MSHKDRTNAILRELVGSVFRPDYRLLFRQSASTLRQYAEIGISTAYDWQLVSEWQKRVQEPVNALMEAVRLHTPECQALINDGADELRRAYGEKQGCEIGALTEWSRLTEWQRDLWRRKFIDELWEFIEKGVEMAKTNTWFCPDCRAEIDDNIDSCPNGCDQKEK